jgi:hypothetical protein
VLGTYLEDRLGDERKAMTPEGAVTAAIVKFLKAMRKSGAPIFYVKLHGGPMQRAGMPDLLVFYGGRTFGIEIKRPGKDATLLQHFILGEMARAGVNTAVVSSVDDVKKIMGIVSGGNTSLDKK